MWEQQLTSWHSMCLCSPYAQVGQGGAGWFHEMGVPAHSACILSVLPTAAPLPGSCPQAVLGVLLGGLYVWLFVF